MFLVVGLGNPGERYADTRHNLGYMVAEAFARKHGASFKRGWRVRGRLALFSYVGKKVVVLLPTTYMNLSGEAVRGLVRVYHAELSHLMVVVDEVYLQFGQVRVRSGGGAAGHNGMRSVEEALQTQEYPRLRMGIGPRPDGLVQSLEDFVLDCFNEEERALLDQCVDRGVVLLEKWLDEGIDGAIRAAGMYRPLIG